MKIKLLDIVDIEKLMEIAKGYNITEKDFADTYIEFRNE